MRPRSSTVLLLLECICPSTGPTILSGEKNYIPDDIRFLTKPQIALTLIDQSLQNGIRVKAWTFDEPYGWDAHFLDGLDQRQQAFVGEVPPNFRVWLRKPRVLRENPLRRGVGRRRRCPRVSGQATRGYEVRNLARATVEICFREAKEELGWDHFECRGWQCVQRHLYVTILSQLFCARTRHRLCRSEVVIDAVRLTLEQVRRAMDIYLNSVDLPSRSRQERYQAELDRIRYHQQCNASASRSHWKLSLQRYKQLGIDPLTITTIHEISPQIHKVALSS